MAQSNQISLDISDADKTAIKTALETLRTKLMPHLISLSIDDRVELPKMGDKTVAFVQKALEYCSQNPEFVPQFLDVDEFKIDVEAVQLLRELSQPLGQASQAIDDSMMLSGSEAYQAALIYYNSVKMAKKTNIPNAGSIYDDLSARFPGSPKKKGSSPSV